MGCSRSLRGGSSSSSWLQGLVRGKKFSLIIFGIVALICAGVMIFLWAESDSQIDRGVKIALTVAIAGILLINFMGLINIANSNIFQFQTSSHGFRYPAEIRMLLLVTTLVLGILSIIIATTTIVPDAQQKTIIAGFIGACSILAGGFYLYYQTSLLPVDFDAVQDYVEKKGLNDFFPSVLDPDKFEQALEVSDLSNDIKDSIAEAFSKGRSSFIKAMNELPFAESVKFKAAYLNPPSEVVAPVVRSTLAENARAAMEPELPSEPKQSFRDRLREYFRKPQSPREEPPLVLSAGPGLTNTQEVSQPDVPEMADTTPAPRTWFLSPRSPPAVLSAEGSVPEARPRRRSFSELATDVRQRVGSAVTTAVGRVGQGVQNVQREVRRMSPDVVRRAENIKRIEAVAEPEVRRFPDAEKRSEILQRAETLVRGQPSTRSVVDKVAEGARNVQRRLSGTLVEPIRQSIGNAVDTVAQGARNVQRRLSGTLVEPVAREVNRMSPNVVRTAESLVRSAEPSTRNILPRVEVPVSAVPEVPVAAAVPEVVLPPEVPDVKTVTPPRRKFRRVTGKPVRRSPRLANTTS